jgi:hypothetical protein
MTRCIHTGITIPECSCQACLLELVRTHAPRPAANAAPTPSVDERLERSQAA